MSTKLTSLVEWDTRNNRIIRKIAKTDCLRLRPPSLHSPLDHPPPFPGPKLKFLRGQFRTRGSLPFKFHMNCLLLKYYRCKHSHRSVDIIYQHISEPSSGTESPSRRHNFISTSLQCDLKLMVGFDVRPGDGRGVADGDDHDVQNIYSVYSMLKHSVHLAYAETRSLCKIDRL